MMMMMKPIGRLSRLNWTFELGICNQKKCIRMAKNISTINKKEK